MNDTLTIHMPQIISQSEMD